MLPICRDTNLKLYEIGELTRELAQKLSCSELTAAVLEMGQAGRYCDAEAARAWMKPHFETLMDEMDMGSAARAAAEKWRSKPSFGNVVVYGDYDVDGVSSTVLAMEIFRHKSLGVRYFIPRRDSQGYGLHAQVLERLTKSGCNTLVIVDCGTNDEDMLYELTKRKIDVFVFDHHSVSLPCITFPFTVNPNIDGDETAKKLCATSVLWSWAWKEEIIPRANLRYALDLAAMATVSDCMPLNALNRAIVQKGLALMRGNPRRGLSVLFEKLDISRQAISEEQLSMRVIPCLNAPGRVGCADTAVRALLEADVSFCVDDLINANKRRRVISDQIVDAICKLDGADEHVMFDAKWPVGVLSGVASRICSERHRAVVLAAPIGGKIRGTLRVPRGANAVGILSSISERLDAWGGHRYAAGFSVVSERWDDVKESLEELLSKIQIEEETIKAISISPMQITLKTWASVSELGPFGNDNPCPCFYKECNAADKILPLGKDGKHSTIAVDNTKILAFNTAPDELRTQIKGWVYHPRVDSWRGSERVQFVLDYAVVEQGSAL
ncbi:phosphoesterase RecJ [Synergistales bacterium]|nr:phosphoesterase RecJ [Synergistales bacterium]